MSRWKLFIPLAVFLALSVLFYRGLFLDPTELPSALIDKPVPEFELASLGQPGQTIENEDLLGKPYLLNVWATWCVSCRYEHPYLIQLAEQGVNIYGINYKDDTDEAVRWLERLGDPYQMNIVDQDGRLGVDLGVFGAPETYVVDSQGVIRYKHVGVVNQEVWQSTMAPIYSQL
ncbi:DsbE family thiol:disulfide interchange protein [Sessilibacter corallicola]|uniref:DsbE family thiol:disulfide interchange protein n=1 Tax=Sessilibacter corallicola TaxID=2904075 RepID=UPI001E28573F|nr:DsbE family thiol:disulfide interchange protein [Sessilibacter corallicola]MCE2029960.1 DsbE family thiol:disulfide interchange protein [Sessilibacter corallicola]